MKKFSRCVLILILVVVASTSGGYMYLNSTLPAVYSSTTKLYVVIGDDRESALRASDGGLNDDFKEFILGKTVISEAQRLAGNSEDIAAYLTINTPANSNIIEIVCTNPDMATAKLYADAVAKATVKLLNDTIPIESIRVWSEGTEDNVRFVKDLYKDTAIIACLAAVVCIFIELVVVLVINAFKPKEDNSDDELEYERRYGMYSALQLASSLKAVGTAQNIGVDNTLVNDVLNDAAISMEINEDSYNSDDEEKDKSKEAAYEEFFEKNDHFDGKASKHNKKSKNNSYKADEESGKKGRKDKKSKDKRFEFSDDDKESLMGKKSSNDMTDSYEDFEERALKSDKKKKLRSSDSADNRVSADNTIDSIIERELKNSRKEDYDMRELMGDDILAEDYDDESEAAADTASTEYAGYDETEAVADTASTEYAGYDETEAAADMASTEYAGYDETEAAADTASTEYAGYDETEAVADTASTEYAGYDETEAAADTASTEYAGYDETEAVADTASTEYAGYDETEAVTDTASTEYAGYDETEAAADTASAEYAGYVESTTAADIVSAENAGYEGASEQDYLKSSAQVLGVIKK